MSLSLVSWVVHCVNLSRLRLDELFVSIFCFKWNNESMQEPGPSKKRKGAISDASLKKQKLEPGMLGAESLSKCFKLEQTD